MNISSKKIALFIIIVLTWMGPAVKIIQVQSHQNNNQGLLQHFCPTKIHSILYRYKQILGKKCTSNFLARYKYGNKQEKGIKNVHVNIISLKYKITKVKNIIQEKSPHIIGLSETELKRSRTDLNQLKIPGYDILFPKSWQVEGIARVIVYVKKTFKYEQILDLENDHVQSIWIRGNFKNCRNIYFCHAYREHMSHLPLESQRNRLEDFLCQWDTALEYDNPNDVNEVHVSLDMNLDSLNGKWLDQTYKVVSLSRIIKNL